MNQVKNSRERAGVGVVKLNEGEPPQPGNFVSECRKLYLAAYGESAQKYGAYSCSGRPSLC